VVGDLLNCLDPAQEALLERRRVESGEHPREGVVGRDAVGQVEVEGEPGPAVAAELLDAGEGVGPGEDAADGDEDDVDQRVPAGPHDARVVEALEVVVERGGSVAGHERVRRGRVVEAP
jgi:hypothetical protein